MCDGQHPAPTPSSDQLLDISLSSDCRHSPVRGLIMDVIATSRELSQFYGGELFWSSVRTISSTIFANSGAVDVRW